MIAAMLKAPNADEFTAATQGAGPGADLGALCDPDLVFRRFALGVFGRPEVSRETAALR